MKREGRHHGNAKSHPNKTARYLEKFPSARVEIRADQPQMPHPKPTNGSKSTGKCKKPRCKSCHYHPVTKSKDKAKGSYKLKSCDVALNHRLVSWRVVGDDMGILDYKGASASAVLKDLAGSIYSSNYSCDEVGEYPERARDVGYDVDISYGYGGGSNNNNNNSIDNSSDFIEFGGLFDEVETEQKSDSTNSIDSSSDFIEFGNLFDETENKDEYKKGTDGLMDFLSDFIGFEGLFDEMEQSDFIGFEGLFDEIESSEYIGFEGLFDEVENEYEQDVAKKHSDLKSETAAEEEEDDDMGFYIVGVTYEFSDGEDWLVVDGM